MIIIYNLSIQTIECDCFPLLWISSFWYMASFIPSFTAFSMFGHTGHFIFLTCDVPVTSSTATRPVRPFVAVDEVVLGPPR